MTTTTSQDGRFDFWRGWLLVMSTVFAVQAFGWILFGSFDPFGLYSTLMAREFWDTGALTPEADETLAFAVVPLGATTAGYFVLVHYLVRFGFARRERWSFHAVVAALAVWFVLDSAFSLWHGAWFNVILVNVPCIVLLGVPLLRLRRYFEPEGLVIAGNSP
mgnify:CR=1 FL=1